MANRRNALRTVIYNFLTGRSYGTQVQDTAHEVAEKAIVDFACISSSPYVGSLYPQLGQAIRFFGISENQPVTNFFISTFIVHRPSVSEYYYYIEISEVDVLLSNNPTIVMEYEYTTTNQTKKTGVHSVPLTEVDGSGVQGKMNIDWDQIEDYGTGEHGYDAQSWGEGGLMPSLMIGGWKQNGMQEPVPTPIDDDASDIDGSEPVYIVDTTDKSINLHLGGVQGNIPFPGTTPPQYRQMISPAKIKNIGANDVLVYPQVTETSVLIEGGSYATIPAHGYAEFVPVYDVANVEYFYVIGIFTIGGGGS